MAQCTLIHSLDQNYDAIVIEKLKKHGFSVSEIFFSAAKDINLKNTDAVVICGGENCRAGLASHMNAYLKKRRESNCFRRSSICDRILS